MIKISFVMQVNAENLIYNYVFKIISKLFFSLLEINDFFKYFSASFKEVDL